MDFTCLTLRDCPEQTAFAWAILSYSYILHLTLHSSPQGWIQPYPAFPGLMVPPLPNTSHAERNARNARACEYGETIYEVRGLGFKFVLIGTMESIGKHWQRQHSKKGCCAKKTQQIQLLVKRRHCSVSYGQGRSRALFTCLALAISPDQARLLGAMRALNGASCAKAHQRMNHISCNLARQSSRKNIGLSRPQQEQSILL